MKRKKIYGIFMLVAIAVFLFAGGRILQIYLNYQESQKVYEQMEEFTQKIEDQDLSPEAVPGETPEEVAEQGFLQVDFNKLEEINPDVIAWIEIPGLEISYPVVQGRDNDYYLHHLITGENHKSGSIFMDFHNQEDLSDRNSINGMCLYCPWSQGSWECTVPAQPYSRCRPADRRRWRWRSGSFPPGLR